MTDLRIGHGYDVHRLTEGRKLILGGVEIPYEKGLLGHSDADVLVHAVMDALTGATRLGDIGKLFPDTDPAYAGISSLKLLAEVGRAAGGKRLRRGEYRRHAAGAGSEGRPLPTADGGKHSNGAAHRPGAGEREGHHGGGPRLHRGRLRDGGPCRGFDRDGQMTVTVHILQGDVHSVRLLFSTLPYRT